MRFTKKKKITADFTFQLYAVGCRRTFGELGCMCHTFALMTQNKTEICLQPKKGEVKMEATLKHKHK